MSACCLLVSDLHLQDPAETTATWFATVLAEAKKRSAQVFILGDLFEAWIGDDAPSAIGDWVAQQLAALSEYGCPLFYLHGNRDFLLGAGYAERCGMRLLGGPTVVESRHGPTLLLHGDELCTDDFAYQQFRSQVRDLRWQQQFLSLPLEQRLAQAAQARAESQAHTSTAAAEIMDVNDDAVGRMFRHFRVRHMIHGHTHRPALHRYPQAQGEQTRLVLGDWHKQPAPHWLDEHLVLS